MEEEFFLCLFVSCRKSSFELSGTIFFIVVGAFSIGKGVEVISSSDFLFLPKEKSFLKKPVFSFLFGLLTIFTFCPASIGDKLSLKVWVFSRRVDLASPMEISVPSEEVKPLLSSDELPKISSGKTSLVEESSKLPLLAFTAEASFLPCKEVCKTIFSIFLRIFCKISSSLTLRSSKICVKGGTFASIKAQKEESSFKIKPESLSSP